MLSVFAQRFLSINVIFDTDHVLDIKYASISSNAGIQASAIATYPLAQLHLAYK
jgi:hypothetical protein